MSTGDTDTLRALWTHGTAKIVERTRNGDPVDLGEIQRAQKALENIEGREELRRLNELVKGES